MLFTSVLPRILFKRSDFAHYIIKKNNSIGLVELLHIFVDLNEVRTYNTRSKHFMLFLL